MMAARLRRDIAIVLVLKLALLIALYLTFFRGDQRPAVDAQQAAWHLFSPQASR